MSADGQWLIAVAGNGKYEGSPDAAYVSTRAKWNGSGFEWEQSALPPPLPRDPRPIDHCHGSSLVSRVWVDQLIT
jgi:hypothetical protein